MSHECQPVVFQEDFEVVENEDNYVCFCVKALPTMLVSTSIWPHQLFLKRPLHLIVYRGTAGLLHPRIR